MPGNQLALSPHGHVYVEHDSSDGSQHLGVFQDDVLARVETAFGRSTAHGLLALGAVEPHSVLPPTFAYWRDFSRHFIGRVCALTGSGEPVDLEHVSPPPGLFDSVASAAPPMTGAEYLSSAVLAGLWGELNQTLLREAAEREIGVPEYLATLNPAWQLVGRICFHLAELRDNVETPFAFLATYVQRISSTGRGQHVRLGAAVQQAAGVRDREHLLALLAPVERAAANNPFITSLVESGALYETLAWTPREAHQFLTAVPALEASGVTVRVPDWWTPAAPPRVQVQVSVGGSEPSQLGTDALLGFDVRLALDGEALSREEWEALRRQTDGLAFVKGRWVEIDRAKLDEVLAHWKGVQRATAHGTLSFGEGLRLLAGAPVEGDAAAAASDSVLAWSHIDAGGWLRETLQQLRHPDTQGVAEDDTGVAAVLRPYQRTGVHWLALLHALRLGGCLADDMGLGKTVQMIALWTMLQRRAPATTAAHRPSRHPTHARRTETPHVRHLLVVPASLLGNWQAELVRFAPSLRVFVLHPSATPRAELAQLSGERLPDADVVITTYGAVARLPWLADVTWETVVLDEAQAIKNPGTKQARAVKALRGRSRFALTGTPIENRLGDLWSLFDFLAPGLLGSARAFSRTVKQLQGRVEAGGTTAYGPVRTLVQPYILRRLKTDPRVIADLPDKTEVYAFCPLSKAQAVLYQSAVDELAAQIKAIDGIARRGVILAFLMRFKQICNHPAQWLGHGGYDPSASGKFGRLRELCDTIAARQEKVLVFTQFREITTPLADFLAGVFGRPGFVLHGGTPPKRRATMVDAFQRDDGPPFFVISLKTGGTGLNLTAASHVVHFDRWWNPAVENQATDRAYRIGQHRNVLVHKFLCRGTVEERIDALIQSKLALSRDLLETDGGTLLTELGDDELISLVTLDLTRAVQEME